MPKFSYKAKVDQIVTKEITLLVTARNEEEGAAKVREALQSYPDRITTAGVERIKTTKATYWIPRSVDIVEVKEEKQLA